MQEVVATFMVARPTALDVARKAQEEITLSNRPGKRKRVAGGASHAIEDAEKLERTTRSKSRKLAASQTSEPEEVIEVDDSEDDAEYQSEEQLSNDGLVECPLGCGKRMKIEAVEPHLDKCEDERRQEAKTRSRAPLRGLGRPETSTKHEPRPQDRISELNYSLLKEQAMARKLREQGIPTWGSKQLMVSRHKEWVNLWNANCDSSYPRSKRELLNELDVWERTQGGKAPNVEGLVNGVMRKDFDGAGWARKNQDDFSRLIADAKRKKNIPMPTPTSSKEETVIVSSGKSPARSEIPSSHDTAQPDPTSSHTLDELTGENGPKQTGPTHDELDAAHSGQRNDPIVVDFQEFYPPNSLPGPVWTNAHGSVIGEPVAKSDNPSLFEQSHSALLEPHRDAERTVHDSTNPSYGLAAHIEPSPAKKVPMFAVPQQPFTDVDNGDMAEL